MTVPMLPPELYARIMQHTRRIDLLSLCLASKEFNSIAEEKLYMDVIIRDAEVAYRFCHSIIAREGYRGAYVRRFWFWQEPRRGQRVPPRLPEAFWIAVQKALSYMAELEDLTMADPSLANTWILDTKHAKFQLVSARLQLGWDINLVTFLNTQTRLHDLMAIGPLDEDEAPCPLASGKLRTLKVFEGPLPVAAELFACPLTHLRLLVEEDTVNILPVFIDNLIEYNQHLRSLSVIHVHPRMVLPLFEGLAAKYDFATRLRYLGTLCLPDEHRHLLYKFLMKLDHLQLLELELSHWDPQPTLAVAQRMLVTELRTYCPSLCFVICSIGHHHTTWAYVRDEWTHEEVVHRSPRDDTLWRMA